MTTHQQEQVLKLLDEMMSAHATVALCAAEVREILCGCLAGAGDAGDRVIVVDASTYSVRWAGKACPLGPTYPFRLIERLCRRPGRFVSCGQLLDDVWRGVRSPDTIRSVVRHLRDKLRDAGMGELANAIESGGGDGYRLVPPLRG